MELSRPRIEFSHQTKTVFVGGLEDGIDDTELKRYFSEFGFVTRALRIPNKDGPKRKFGENGDLCDYCGFLKKTSSLLQSASKCNGAV